MIQILGLRDYKGKKHQKRLKHAFFEAQWRAPSVAHLLGNIEEYISKIPEDERYNLFFTPANCKGEEPRDFDFSEVISFDVDGIDLNKIPETVNCVVEALSLEYNKTGILCSGNGLQLFVSVQKYPIQFFDAKKAFYKLVCQHVNHALKESDLPGSLDPVVFESKRLMRLPQTRNIKEDKPERKAYLIQSNMEPQGFSFGKVLGIDEARQSEQISLNALKVYPKPDTPTVLSDCDFLKYARESQGDLSEPEWYAMLGIVGHLEDGENLVHEFSIEHPGYDQELTTRKTQQAIVASGPRTCEGIDKLWGKCSTCPNFGKVKSPILLQGVDFIRTESTGFHDVVVSKNGRVEKKPNHDDLLRYFTKKHSYFTHHDNGIVYTHNGRYWEVYNDIMLRAFAETHFNPKPMDYVRKEFMSKVKSSHISAIEWADQSRAGKINLQNGVYDIKTGELLPHSTKYFFEGVLPFEFDPMAKAPMFEQFMKDITLNRQELIDVLLEFVGYAICHSQDCMYEKALLMHGDGANGKSTFIDIVKALIDKNLYSSLLLSSLENEQSAANLMGKIINIGEETNLHALSKGETFKTIATGGDVSAKLLYRQPFSFRCTAKLMFACNELPYTRDRSNAVMRRLLLVPFDAVFEGEHDNKNIKAGLLKELPGILNLVIESYKRLVKRGRFNQGEVLTEQLEEYRNENDIIRQFISNEVVVSEESMLPKSEVFDKFLAFCDDCNIPKHQYQYSKQAFGKHFTKVVSKIHRGFGSKRAGKKMLHVYTGIAFADALENRVEI